jgi:hypothetical protein
MQPLLLSFLCQNVASSPACLTPMPFSTRLDF